MTEYILRFLIGGVVVSAFAVLAEMLRPKSFAGLFSAAPSVALATVGITALHHGRLYVAMEARSMILGAIAFLVYAALCSWVLLRRKHHALAVTTALLPVWFGVSAGLLWMVAR